MTPATIERARRRGAITQLSLDVLDGVRASRLAPEARVIAPATAAARAAAVAPAPAAAAPDPAAVADAPAAPPAAASGGTLDDLISGAWREIGAQRVAACPVCAEPMRPVAGSRGGQCAGCGATLA